MRIIALLILFGHFSAISQTHHEKFNGQYFNHIDDILGGTYELKKKLDDGRWFFYEGKDSVLRLEVNFLNGKKNGVEKKYRGFGGIYSEIYYENGVINGKKIKFNYDSDTISIQQFKNGKRHGTQIYYNQRNLDCHTVYQYVNGRKEGKSISYLANSSWKRSETTWVKGRRHGPYKAWYSNGQLEVSGQYYPHKNYKYLYSDHNKDGDWTHWNKNGEIIKIVHWKKEKLLGITEYISGNTVDLAIIDTAWITTGCFGKYCLGDSIHQYIKKEGSYRKHGDSIYYMHSGDSLDRIILSPTFADTNIVQEMFTISPNFRTSKNIGVGSTIHDIITSGENVVITKGKRGNGLSLVLEDYGIVMGVDEETVFLYRYQNPKSELINLRPEGYVTFLKIESVPPVIKY